MLVVVALLCAVTCTTSILSVLTGQQWISIFGVLAVFTFLVVTRLFGSAELSMLARRTAHFGESMMVRTNHSGTKVHQKCVQLQGNRHWDLIWQSVVEFAIDRELSKIKLDVSVAWMEEGYHGSWQRSQLPEKSERMCLQLPLYLNDRLIGRVEVIGNAKNPVALSALDQMSDRIHELQTQIALVIGVDNLKISAGIPATTAEMLLDSSPFTAEKTSDKAVSSATDDGTYLPSNVQSMDRDRETKEHHPTQPAFR